VLEQKVWIVTSSPMYPNLYVFLIAPPGVGKSRIMSKSRELLEKLPDPVIAPTSINSSTLLDHMLNCKRSIINPPNPAIEYHTCIVHVSEFGTFMDKFDDALVARITAFFNVEPFGEQRRGNGGSKKLIARPQLNMLVGSTPSNLMKFMPEGAWDQGFTSRILFIYSNDKIILDDFAEEERRDDTDLTHDLSIINAITGQFRVTDDYRSAVNNWRALGEPPKITHPRLLHYAARRREHLYRLSMVAAIDRSNTLLLTKDDFNVAMGWMVEAEEVMPEMFVGVSTSSDASAMDEIAHFVLSRNLSGKGVAAGEIVAYARKKLPAHAVLRVIELMEMSGMLVVVSTSRHGVKSYAAPIPKAQLPRNPHPEGDVQ
jgi:hypothetical protein